jgi:hypothetical protein
MAKKSYRQITDFPGYEISKSGVVRQHKIPVQKFADEQFVNLRKGQAIYVKNIEQLIAEVFNE